MNTRFLSFRYTIYWCGVGAVTLLLTLLRSIAFFADYDADIGYFTNAFSVTLGIPTVLALVGCFSLLLFIKRGELPEEQAPLSLAGAVSAGTVAVTLIIVAISVVVRIAERNADPLLLTAPLPLMIPAACFALLGAPYFLLQLIGKPKLAPMFGYAVILAAILMLSVTYFDRYTPMNAPHKISVHLSMLAIMAYMLYELRAILKQSRPRALTVVSAITLLITAPTGASNLIAYLGNKVDDPLYLSCDLLALAMALYITMRIANELLALRGTAEPIPENARDDGRKDEAEPIPENARDDGRKDEGVTT